MEVYSSLYKKKKKKIVIKNISDYTFFSWDYWTKKKKFGFINKEKKNI